MHRSKHVWKYLLALSCLLLWAAASCDTSIKTDKAEIGEAIESDSDTLNAMAFEIDTAKSEMTWIGAKVTGRHNGIFKIQSGEMLLHEGELMGGNIIIDMASTRSTDKTIDEASNKKLTTHLRSEDFFDVERHTTAVFEFTSAEPYDSTSQQHKVNRSGSYSELRVKDPTHRIKGNLTIKGKKKGIAFPAKVVFEDNVLRAKANFNIDRTQWDLIYRADKSLGNKTIHPDVNIGFSIVAKQRTPEK